MAGRFGWTIAMLLGLTLAGGCTPETPPPEDQAPNIDPAQVQLAEAAQSVSKSLVLLDEIQQAATPPKQMLEPPEPSSYGMGQIVSVDWLGPLQPLVEKIGELTDYKVRVLGTQPAVPVLVTINEKRVPIGEILRNAGYQSKQKADIIIFPSNRVIELRYLPA